MYCVETRSINKRPTFPSHENKVYELHFLVYKKSLENNERKIYCKNHLMVMLRFVRYDNQLRLRNIEPFPTGKRKMKGYVVMNLYP